MWSNNPPDDWLHSKFALIIWSVVFILPKRTFSVRFKNVKSGLCNLRPAKLVSVCNSK